jgi:hypothetical protein
MYSCSGVLQLGQWQQLLQLVVVARLAVKLPQGDLAGQARTLAAVQGGRDPNKTEEQQEEEELL